MHKLYYFWHYEKIRLSRSKQHKLIKHLVSGTTARCASEVMDHDTLTQITR